MARTVNVMDGDDLLAVWVYIWDDPNNTEHFIIRRDEVTKEVIIDIRLANTNDYSNVPSVVYLNERLAQDFMYAFFEAYKVMLTHQNIL